MLYRFLEHLCIVISFSRLLIYYNLVFIDVNTLNFVSSKTKFDSINNIVVAGYTFTSGSYGDFLIVKYDSLGTILWQDILDIGGYWDHAYGVAFDKEGNIIVTGSAAINSLHAYDYCTVKYEYVAGIAEETNSITGGNSNPITCIITGPLVLPEGKSCKVFDIIGKEVIPHKIRPGIYFIEVEGYITSKVVKLR